MFDENGLYKALSYRISTLKLSRKKPFLKDKISFQIFNFFFAIFSSLISVIFFLSQKIIFSFFFYFFALALELFIWTRARFVIIKALKYSSSTCLTLLARHNLRILVVAHDFCRFFDFLFLSLFALANTAETKKLMLRLLANICVVVIRARAKPGSKGPLFEYVLTRKIS